ncbi:RHS repeat-associated core domain-containing protein [Flavobacteriaceae bacterium M23B6Z8]
MEMDMRQYDAALARWVVQDPVTHHSMSPYNAFDNNPVYWADPSGADAVDDMIYKGGLNRGSKDLSDSRYNLDLQNFNKSSEETWTAKVNDEGETEYHPGKKSSAKSLHEQYAGVTLEMAESLTNSKGDEVVDKNFVLTGESVLNKTGNEVLKLDLASPLIHGNDQAIFDQIMFSLDHSKTYPQNGSIFRSSFITDPSLYFSNYTSVGKLSGTASIKIEGNDYLVNYDFPLYRVGTSKNNPGVWNWENYYSSAHQGGLRTPSLKPFGKNREGFRGYAVHPLTKKRSILSGNWRIDFHSSSYRIIKKRLERKLPIIIRNVKN